MQQTLDFHAAKVSNPSYFGPLSIPRACSATASPAAVDAQLARGAVLILHNIPVSGFSGVENLLNHALLPPGWQAFGSLRQVQLPQRVTLAVPSVREGEIEQRHFDELQDLIIKGLAHRERVSRRMRGLGSAEGM